MVKRLLGLFIILPATVFFVMWQFLHGSFWAGEVVLLFVVAFVAAPVLQVVAGVNGGK